MTKETEIKEEIEKVIDLEDKDELILNGKQLREWKFLIKKELIDRIKEELILSRNKYGIDWCDQLFMKHIDNLAGENFLDEEFKSLSEKSICVYCGHFYEEHNRRRCNRMCLHQSWDKEQELMTFCDCSGFVSEKGKEDFVKLFINKVGDKLKGGKK